MRDLVNLDIKNLSAWHVDALPIPYDWQAWRPDDSEERPWSWAEVVECPKCRRAIVAADGYLVEHNESETAEDEVPCSGSGDHCPEAEGPMMSYWYPCDLTTGEDMIAAASYLADMCVCVVEVDGKSGIALTGGGMDLSWEICEAYVRLGQMPPIHFARNLPRMADKRLSARTLAILEACEQTCEVTRVRAVSAIEGVYSLRRQLSETTCGVTDDLDEDPRIPDDERKIAKLIAQGWRNGVTESVVVYLHIGTEG